MAHICALRINRQTHGPHDGCRGFRLTEQEGGPPNDAIMAWEIDPMNVKDQFFNDFMKEKPVHNPDDDKRDRDLKALRDWWVDLANEEFERVGPKAIEYGAYDLIEIGKTLAYTMNRHDLTDAQRAEMGIYFYIVGKMGRWTDAIANNREVSEDTLHDLGVYVRMAQRIRAVGAWPFLPEEEI